MERWLQHRGIALPLLIIVLVIIHAPEGCLLITQTNAVFRMQLTWSATMKKNTLQTSETATREVARQISLISLPYSRKAQAFKNDTVFTIATNVFRALHCIHCWNFLPLFLIHTQLLVKAVSAYLAAKMPSTHSFYGLLKNISSSFVCIEETETLFLPIFETFRWKNSATLHAQNTVIGCAFHS